MMLCILFFLTFINSENGFIITHGHRYGLFRQPYYYHHHHHPLHHQHYYYGFNRPFNHIRYLLHRNCTCEGGCYSCQYKRVPYYFGCGMFKMECEKGKGNGTNNTDEKGPGAEGARKLNPVQLSIDEPTKTFNTTDPTWDNASDEDDDSGLHSGSREDTIKSKEIKIIASSSTTESTVSTSTASTVPTSTESTVSTTPTTLVTSSASSISVTNATTQSTEKSTVTTVATSSTTYIMKKQRRSNF